MEELWKDAPGLERQQVSTLGRVRNKLTPGFIYKCNGGPRGYKEVTLDGKTFVLGRLVLETFVGPCPAGEYCIRINGNHSDCRLENLKWGRRGKLAGHRTAIKEKYSAGASKSQLARDYGVSHVAIIKALRE